ncbi:MAG: hypothetical protein F6K16_28515 [Symploca sp. SIO2B6]|nr:hypothetical protein [Symploca sp. SIO2B6]
MGRWGDTPDTEMGRWGDTPDTETLQTRRRSRHGDMENKYVLKGVITCS